MDKTILIETRDSHLILKINEIIRIEADETSSVICLKNGKKINLDAGMGFWIVKLHEHPFIKVHDHHLVNLNAIESYDLKDPPFVTMNNGEHIKIQNKYKTILKEFWSQATKCN